MSKKNLVIINNEKIYKKENNFYCDNIDLKTLPDELNKNFKVTLITRKSKTKRSRLLNLINVKISSNIFSFLFNILKTFKENNSNYLIVSITPYTFFSYLILFIFNKKIFVYLRSDGYEEYKSILGFYGPAIYYLMFKTVTFKSKIIKCQDRLFTKRKSNLVFPSELDPLWLKNLNKAALDKARLLYVGRVKVEKGIFSLAKIFDDINNNVSLSIVGKVENKNFDNKKILFINYEHDTNRLIKIYDDHNIFILPSFTEAHPKVIDESLARLRPVIVFDEIKHIVQNKKGIFTSKRNAKSLLETIDFIMKNYLTIQEDMKKNKLPTKHEFINEMNSILS
jgi:glycosyltransferase involved in cell wall biosynthesis